MTDDVLFLSGNRAPAQVRATARVRDLESVRLWGPDPGHRTRDAATSAAELPFPVEALDSAWQAVTGASLFAPGRTVVGAGSFEPTGREVDPEVV
ncbi:ornithine cyclodeaminase family protein, partial [Streptomyces sp. W16]|nr:ornithine cyclodeaminase family protein [Streptomyces sp. W16]